MSEVNKQFANAIVDASAAVTVLQRIENLTLADFEAMTPRERSIVVLSVAAAKREADSILEGVAREAATRRAALQREILEHRLAVPQCVYESLFDDEGDERTEANYDAVDRACKSLELRLAENDLWPLSAIERNVLVDCVESSTYLASMIGGTATETAIRETHAATRNLAKKVGEFLGVAVGLPREAETSIRDLLGLSDRVEKRIAAQQRP